MFWWIVFCPWRKYHPIPTTRPHDIQVRISVVIQSFVPSILKFFGGGHDRAAMTEELSASLKNAYKVNIVEILRVDEECFVRQFAWTYSQRYFDMRRVETGSRLGEDASTNLYHLLPSTGFEVLCTKFSFGVAVIKLSSMPLDTEAHKDTYKESKHVTAGWGPCTITCM